MFIFTLILRNLLLGLCLSGGEIHWLEGGLPATVSGSMSGLTHSSLEVVAGTSTVSVSIHVGTQQIFAGGGNFRFYALLKLCLLKDFTSNHPS